MSILKEQLIKIVNKIPVRRVAYFGQIAEILREKLEKNISAQLVGRQLSGMPEHERSQLPWWRVVSKEGYISSLKLGEKGIKQIHLLEKEGIPVENNKVDMEIFGVETNELMG